MSSAAAEVTPIGQPGFEEVRAMIGAHLGADLAHHGPQALLREELGWDSLTFLEVVALAHHLGVDVPEDMLLVSRTLGDVSSSFESQLGRGSGPRTAPLGPAMGLIPVEQAHEPWLWRLHTDGEQLVSHRLRGSVPSPERFHQFLWDHVLAQFVVAAPNGDLVGLVTALQPDLRNRHTHVAVLVERSWRGSGLALEGLARLTTYLFRQFDLRKVYAEVLARNLPAFGSGAGRLFVVEGRLSCHEYIDGAYEDLLLLATSRREWRRAHQRLFGGDAGF